MANVLQMKWGLSNKSLRIKKGSQGRLFDLGIVYYQKDN
jgi:hypothetical protein